jgi:zinc transporter ZupT
MDTVSIFLIYTVALIGVSMVGAYLPYIRPLTDKQVHLLVALSSGIFLGILFFLLLPEAIHESAEGNISPTYVCITIMFGFLAILFVDVLMKHHHMAECPCECHEDEHSHNLTSMSAFIGLSVHAFVDGLVLATGLLASSDIGWITLLGMCIHKLVVLFSLSSTFVLAEQPKKVAMKYLFSFAIITPIAAVISFIVLNGMSVEGLAGLPLAFSAGTFMYVALCDMVPEAFHRKSQELKSFAFLLIGLAIAAAVFLLIGHGH